MKHGKVPNNWQTVIIIFIHEKGDRKQESELISKIITFTFHEGAYKVL